MACYELRQATCRHRMRKAIAGPLDAALPWRQRRQSGASGGIDPCARPKRSSPSSAHGLTRPARDTQTEALVNSSIRRHAPYDVREIKNEKENSFGSSDNPRPTDCDGQSQRAERG